MSEGQTKTKGKKGSPIDPAIEVAAKKRFLTDPATKAALQAGARPKRAFAPIATLIKPSPPSWLVEVLFGWYPSIRMSLGVEVVQPSRVEMREILLKVSESAFLLVRALSQPSVTDFLNAGGSEPLPPLGHFPAWLRDIDTRAQVASRSSALVNKQGKTKAGKGRAALAGTTSSQVFCAMLIAETFNHVHGRYPAPSDAQAGNAADQYWRLSAVGKQTYGDFPLTAWRRHFKAAERLRTHKEAAEYRRHLRNAEFAARQLEQPDDSTPMGEN